MSPTEFAFLALGLVLGIAVGAAVAEVVRARPAPRREVRLTVSPNSITPRRPSTLASEAREGSYLPATGGPAGDLAPGSGLDAGPDGAGSGFAVPGHAQAHRTLVPSRIASGAPTPAGMPVFQPAPRPTSAAPRPAPMPTVAPRPPVATQRPSPRAALLTLEAPATRAAPAAAAIAEPLAPEPPRASTTDVGGHAGRLTVRVRPWRDGSSSLTLPATAVGIPVAAAGPASDGPAVGDDDAASGGGSAMPRPVDTDQCAAARRVAAERCEVADLARKQAAAAADVLHQARRGYDALRERVDRQERLADPREVRAAKDLAHRAFRDARASATTAEEAESAARDWLAEINRVNMAARAAVEGLAADRGELTVALPRLERLAVEADAARITAETAEAGCREAREALAACEEAAATPPPAPPARDPDPEPAPGWPPHPDPSLRPDASAPSGSMDPGAGVARVLRILRGDRVAREAVVAQLAGTDAEEARRWRLAIADLVDAIVARAIEDGYLEVDAADPFWGMFDPAERRDIVSALSALGFRFDGLGGFADGRVPAQRDLSLAVGYAGLDRMRVRHWPREAELGSLYAGAAVAADEWLAAEGGDLALGRMIDALGNRAGDLADVWNAWGRVRPLLLAPD